MRGWKGGPHPLRALTDDQVREVFALYRSGMTMKQIGERMGSNTSGIGNILNRKMYRDVEVEPVEIRTRAQNGKGRRSPQRGWTDDQVREMRRLAAEGVTQREIAQRFRGKQTNISEVIRRRIYKDVVDLPESPPAP